MGKCRSGLNALPYDGSTGATHASRYGNARHVKEKEACIRHAMR
jgi:hypothetical protein